MRIPSWLAEDPPVKLARKLVNAEGGLWTVAARRGVAANGVEEADALGPANSYDESGG